MDEDLKKIIYDEVYKLFYERHFQWLDCKKFDPHTYACNYATNMVITRIESALEKKNESN